MLGAVFGRGLRRALELTVVALLIEYVLLPQFAASKHDLHRLFTLDSPWLLLVVGAEAASLCAFAIATRSILPAATRPPFSRVLRIDLSTIALSHSVPAGGAAGTVMGLRLLQEAGVPLGDAAFTKVAQGAGSAVVLQTLLLTALAAAVATSGLSPTLTALAIAGLALITVLVAGVIALRSARHRLASLLSALTKRLPFVHDDLGHRFVIATAGSLDRVLGDRRVLANAVIWSTMNWALDAIALWASVRTYGHSLSYLALMVPFGIASTLTWIPLTPGGVGFVEAALVPLLVGFGTDKSAALLGLITWRLVAFWLPIPLGGIAYASLRSRVRGSQASASHTSAAAR